MSMNNKHPIPSRHHETFDWNTCEQINEYCKQNWVTNLSNADIDMVVAAYQKWLMAKGFAIIDTTELLNK